MAASLLEENLRTLHKSLAGSASQKENAVGIVTDLNQICVQELTDKDIDFTCSCLFNKEFGLVSFLSKAVTNDELQICKARTLELLCDFIEKTGKKVLPYAVDIKDICISLFSRDRYARVKNAAMPVLTRLLAQTVGSTMGKELQIDKLITKFFNELTKASKLASSVKEKIYILLGIIAEIYPEYMTPYSERLTGIYLGALKAEMNAKTRKPELVIISGCLEGLYCSLVHFTEASEDGSKNSYEIYKYARSAIDPKVELSRYDVPKAGLQLFARHSSQFSQYLIEDYENLYTKMSYWSHHKNSELVKAGNRAIESFLTQIAEMLKEKAKEGKQEGGRIFKYFVRQFRDIMHKESASDKELALSIKGYGLLAGPCRSYLSQADVQFMFEEMLTKTEQQFLGESGTLEAKIFNLSSYLESLASIVKEMETLSETYAVSLEHLMVLLMENIPNIHTDKHFLCQRAFLWLLIAVMPKGTVFKQLLSGFVFQSLIRSCSHMPVVQTENEGETSEDIKVKVISYKDFMQIWSGLLEAAQMKEFAAAGISIETRSQLTDALYSELMSSVLRILGKLDLSSAADTTKQEEGPPSISEENEELGVTSADPLLGQHANKPKDHQIFINLVDFCRDLLLQKHFEKFEEWMFTYTHKLILMSSDCPLASGFYKLLSICMKIASKLNYFQDISGKVFSPALKQEAMETDAPQSVGQAQKYPCYLLLMKFSKEVLVRMKQYRDELLASCLTFILALPKEVISEQMVDVIPAIQVTLTLGLSYLPLAMVAMDALESWSRSLPLHTLLPYYKDILPHLDNYLKTVDQGAEDVNVDSNVSTTKSKSGKGRKKLTVRLIKGKRGKVTQSFESQLTQVKQRIVKYLGQLGGSINYHLLSQADEEMSHKAIAWDTMQHLKFDMPFVDMKPTIYLDPFLSHVSDLAMTSSDRQTKVAACELLHSLVLFTIGRGAQQPGADVERASMASIYKNIFPVMLKLACDVELVSKQLFEPLTMQVIHWFTGNKKAESPETIMLLDAIFDGIIQQADTALRDFCAKCLHEFMKWSIKQTSAKAAETNPVNAKSVLKRLYSFSRHPSAFKRLGAALAFNNIYTVFREEEPLVNMFTFELMVHFVDSLAIAHGDEKSLGGEELKNMILDKEPVLKHVFAGTQEHCCKALEHLDKIIRHKAKLLQSPSKLRKEPRNWNTITLEIAVRWLTRQCGRPQTECRHACMKLSYQLCTLIPGIKSQVHFFQACLKGKGAVYWIQRFEGGGHTGKKKQGIEGYPHLTDTADVFSLETTLSWFDSLLAALDCYTWVFGENLLSAKELFGGSGKSNVFTTLGYFLSNVALKDIYSVAKLFSVKAEEEYFTPREIDRFNRSKCTVIVRLLGFLTVMLAKFKKETLAVVPKTVWGSDLMEVICSCVINPGDVGFNMGDVEIMKNLPQEIAQTLAVFSMSFKNEIISHLKKTLTGDRNVFDCLPIALDDSTTDHIHLHQMLSGYLQLQEVGLLLPAIQGHSQDKCTNDLLNNVFEGIINTSAGTLLAIRLSPMAISTAQVILKLAFSFGLSDKRLVECILDPTPVCSGSDRATVQLYGDLFFSMFKGTIAKHCVAHIKTLVPLLVKHAGTDSHRISTVLTSAVETVTKDRDLRKQEGPSVLSTILASWPNLSVWWGKSATTDQQSMALLLLTKLLLIDSKFTSDPSHKSFDHVFSMYQNMLTDTKTNLAFKCRVLELLPFFAAVPESHTAKLKSCLDRLVADNFPLRSSELTKGSQKYNDYIAALERILSALQLTGSHMLLEYLISIFCKEREHCYEDAIVSAITKFTRRLPRDKQKNAVDVPYKIFVKTGSFPSEIRRATIERVALPMLRTVSKSALLEFYMDHISNIREFIEAKLSKSSEGILEGQLVTRLCCFQLLEMMYTRLSKDEVVGMASEINKKFAAGNVTTGKELTQFVSVQAHGAKGEDCRGESTLLELRRQYHCTAHNLMIAFISRTQTELKYYTAFLFEEKEAKGQFLLENFIDKDKNYEFPIELMSPMERKKKFVSIHQDMKERMKEDEDSDDEASPSVHLASQYLADSSLSEDVSQYFTMSGTVGSLSSQGSRRRKRSKPIGSTEDDETQVTVEGDFVELEMDELNKHECMAMMIAVLKHMQKNKITPEVPSGSSTPGMPSWMDKLHSKMMNNWTHHNIKLFIAKLIINTAEVFESYAGHWLQPLCQLIIGGPLGSGTVNYFIVDLVVTMLSWSKTAIPKDNVEEKAMASRLVHFVVKNIFHENRQVFRNNLEMLKTLLECWKPRIEIPYQEIYGQFSNPDMKSKDNIVGVQVMGVVLACKFPPYGPIAPVDRERFFSKIANNMNSSSKQIYAPTAEICGMIFQYLADKEDEKDGSFHTYVNNLMNSLHQAKPDSFVTCVHRMQKHYLPIADRFINKLLFMLPQLHGEFRTLCLEVLHGRIDQVENVFLELKSKGIVASLTHRDEATQLISLKIVKAVVSKLKANDLGFLMPAITAFNANPSAACRIVMYEILMWVYDNYRYEESEESMKIIVQTKESLLKGLGDEDLHCRLQVQNFWSSETRLPVGTLDRLVAMLEAMYSPVTEQKYLSYATNLLLEMTSKSPDYQREVFELPLSQCKFVDYNVKSSWRQRHAAMTPLFATQSSQSQMEMEDSVDGIRATMDTQQFSATVEPGAHKGPFNWLTQSSLDTYSDNSVVSMETQSTTSSSLLFTMGTSDMKVRTRLKPGPGFGKQKLTVPKASTSSTKKEDVADRSEFYKLKRRFVKDQEQSRIYFANRNIRLKELREQKLQEQKARRENQVTMYRKYRSGDLPDIQIKYSYIIAPLQALAHRDSTVAKLLFSAIFQAIFCKMEEVKTDREAGEVLAQINTSLDGVLSQSTQYYSPFIGCVLDILYKLRSQLKVDVVNVGGGSIFSKLQPLGIVVLEEQLIIHDPGADKRAAKKGRFETNVSEDIPHWIELSRLYKSVEEFDVLMGIFGGKIGTQDLTQKAVEAEARGDYAAAKKIYDEALEKDWTGSRPSEAECDLWEDCRMECLIHLSQWDQLEVAAVEAVDNSDTPDICKVWEDTFLQEHFLPYILTSKVKLMLQGDEDQQSLLDFIDSSMKNPEQKLVLENRFSEELSLMYLWQEDYDRARHYNRMAVDFFLQEWSSTDSLMLASRTASLHKLQPLIETQEFLQFMEEENNFQSMEPAQRLVRAWNKRTPHLLTDPVNVWDEVVTNRSVYMDHISGKLVSQASSQDSMEEEEDMFLDTKLRLKLKMAESCKEQNNFTLTLRILKETHSMCRRSDSPDLICEWTHLYASTHHKKSQTSLEVWTDDSMNSVLTTLDQLGKIEDTENLVSSPALIRRHHVLSGQALELIALGLQGFSVKDLDGTKAGQKLLELSGMKKLHKQELTEQLIQDGYNKMKASLTAENVHVKQTVQFGQEEAYLATAKYCDNILRLKEDDELSISSSCVKQFPETVTVCLLKAIKLNSMEARQRFPRLLQIVELYPDTMANFIKKSKEVPAWMFLLWTSQMFAALDKTEAPAVHGILEEISTLYPQAVVYPFKLSQEGYSFGSSKTDKMNEAVVEKLNALLGPEKLPISAKFMSALDCFSQPDQDFKDLFEELGKLIKKREKARVQQKYKELYWRLLDYKTREEQEGKPGQSKSSQRSQSARGSGQQGDDDDQSILMSDSVLDIGSYARKFADKFKTEFDKKLGQEGRKLQDMSLKEFGAAKAHLLDLCTKEMKDKLKPPIKLSEYSRWMSDFSPNTHGRSLEMPGQYTGLTKPLPEYHVKVSGFDQRVMVMSSLRKPKRITIRGNDEKEYHFLVKGGEDLRQDQRIEQLFYIMNQVFNKDPVCRNRKLALKTYQVVPMTTRVGLIEWMSNTKPLKDFLRESLTKQEEQFINSRQGPSHVQQVWIAKHKKDKDGTAAIYANVYKNYSYTETGRQFNIVQSKIPWDLSRRAFQKMSTSPEAYHVLRSHCAKTHAMICICQYILGIGDRHLSNFMVNLKTGEMVGIDFGHAFGSATQFLPVPELMPFRLTRQIQNLMLPLGVKGLIENTMMHVLQALRSDSDLLLNTMDIFVKEPSLDWKQNAERQISTMRDEDLELYQQEGEEMEWYPKEKIDYVKRKLKGANPSYITRDELKLGHGKKVSFRDFETVALGDKNLHARAQLPAKGLTVEQQVTALIDQATDTNILGRTYMGWEPWM